MSKVQPYNVNFGSRIKMSTVNSVVGTTKMIVSQTTVNGLVKLGDTSAGILGGTFDVIGTAFSAKSVGVDSFGIVPRVIDMATPNVAPQTIATAHAYPSAIASFFSSLGAAFVEISSRLEKVLKDPS